MRALLVTLSIILAGYLVLHSDRLEILGGSGHVEMYERSVDSFDQIDIRGATRVFLQQGPDCSVRVEGEDNILEHLVTEVKSGALKVYLNKPDEYIRLRPTETVTVYITAPTLSRICVKGAADITSEGVWKGESMRIQMHGAAEVDLSVDVQSLAISSQGAGHVYVEGKAQDLNLIISGASDFEGESLKCATSSVAITGNGHATLAVKKQLKVRVTGTGTILYTGNPTIDSEINGFGTIERV